MKKTLLLIVLAVASLTTLAQDSTKTLKTYDTGVWHNEFGIDATAFIKQFFNFNTSEFGSNYYAPTYYLTYRRHFKPGNIRFAIGGDFSDQDIPSPFLTDPKKYHANSYSFDARIGWEFYTNLGKRWQAFYGVDFRPSYSYSKNDAPYWNGGYANGTETKAEIYGIAPLLGFRFKLNNRLSLTTETSYSINFSSTSGRRYFIPVDNQYPPMPDVIIPKTKRMYSSFSQPVSLILTFNF